MVQEVKELFSLTWKPQLYALTAFDFLFGHQSDDRLFGNWKPERAYSGQNRTIHEGRLLVKPVKQIFFKRLQVRFPLHWPTPHRSDLPYVQHAVRDYVTPGAGYMPIYTCSDSVLRFSYVYGDAIQITKSVDPDSGRNLSRSRPPKGHCRQRCGF
jgi:hypothetical protein